MAIAVTIPRLGWNMDEGVFAGWLLRDGDLVRPGDRLFTLESEKSTEDIESLDSGIIRISPTGPSPGDKVAVGTVIGYLVQPGEAAPFEGPAPAAATTEPPAGPAVRRLARELGVELAAVSGSGPGGRVTAQDVQKHAEPRTARRRQAISPRARRAAAELGIDWTRLKGTGRTGRIRERDVRAAAAAATGAAAAPVARSVAAGTVRRTIAQRLLRSLRETAPVTLTTSVDAGNLVNLRRQFQAAGLEPPTYTDFLVKLAAIALREHPALNASWEDDRIVLHEQVHIGIAVDTDAGLFVPVIRDVPALTLKQLAARSRDLIERARQRTLRPEEMQGGTFTVTNLGVFGIDAFTPIINYPECAILGVGRIDRQPVVREDRVVPGERLTLSLTFDHRIVDGAPAARFLQMLSRLVENPGPSLIP